MQYMKESISFQSETWHNSKCRNKWSINKKLMSYRAFNTDKNTTELFIVEQLIFHLPFSEPIFPSIEYEIAKRVRCLGVSYVIPWASSKSNYRAWAPHLKANQHLEVLYLLTNVYTPGLEVLQEQERQFVVHKLYCFSKLHSFGSSQTHNALPQLQISHKHSQEQSHRLLCRRIQSLHKLQKIQIIFKIGIEEKRKPYSCLCFNIYVFFKSFRFKV